MAKKPNQTVTIKIGKNGDVTMKSTGGYDLRRLGLPLGKAPKKAGA
ncbi:hypothetical protein [Agrobacterium vitis]|nr:hypothetical protein [Agrobacterium vitis]MUZ63521.1 hypothetical protein [Agrobacterium vitis]